MQTLNVKFSIKKTATDLVLQECKIELVKSLNISVLALKSLSIDCFSYEHYDDCVDDDNNGDDDYWHTNGNEYSQYKNVVDVPNLEVLKYDDHIAEGYALTNFHSLVRAEIHVVLGKG